MNTLNTLKHLYTVFVLSFTPLCPISLHMNLNKFKRTSCWF